LCCRSGDGGDGDHDEGGVVRGRESSVWSLLSSGREGFVVVAENGQK